MSIIRAIEIGYGTLSLTKRVVKGVPEIETFSSIVAPVSQGGDLSGGLSKRDTVVVNVDDEWYEVGPDAHLLNDRTSSRTLNNRYIETPQFRALFKGALLRMDITEIDLLVLALPVNTMRRADELKEFAIGQHKIGLKTIVVKNVWVLCQPLAGFLAYANQIGQQEFNNLCLANVLCLDFGFTTADWLVTMGLKINYKRSGAQNMGMSAVLESCAETLKNSEAFRQFDDISLSLIDEAFYKRKNEIRISGRGYPFPTCKNVDINNKPVNVIFDCKPGIRQIASSCLQEVRNNVGAGADISLIVIMGGSHEVYLDAVKENYPNHNIVIVENPLTAVCLGMYAGGVQYQSALDEKGKVA